MTKFTAAGCNIFAGLFTLGVSKHFQVLAHLEHDTYGVATAQLNFPKLEVYTSGPASWPDRLDVDFIYSNPPCAVWSRIGKSVVYGARWQDDPRLQRARDAASLMKRYRPRFWCWESVPPALSKGRTFIHELAVVARRSGYATSVLQINAQTMGVPQDRSRVFVVCHRVAFEPAPCDYETVTTVGDAWKGLLDPVPEVQFASPAVLALLKWAKPGTKLRQTHAQHVGEDGPRTQQGRLIGRPGFAHHRLDLKKPCGPMMEQFFHPTLRRRISTREAMRLCQLPDTWQFQPTGAAEKKLLMQRAVMPGVGEWLARGVKRSLQRNLSVDHTAPALVYDLRKPNQDIREL